MRVTNAAKALRFEVEIRNKEEFAASSLGISGQAFTLANSAWPIEIEFSAFNLEKSRKPPQLLIEIYVDGVLRNVLKPRTGRGLSPENFGEAIIDRGVVLSTNGVPIMKRFHFVDLDLDDAILESRLVKEAGSVELKILDAGAKVDKTDEDQIELPCRFMDHGAISLLHGELNNTVGIRFDEGEESIQDTRYNSLENAIEIIMAREIGPLGELLARFSFTYGSSDLLKQLGVVPLDHKIHREVAAIRRPICTKESNEMDEVLVKKAVLDSDYTLCANFPELVRSRSDEMREERSPARELWALDGKIKQLSPCHGPRRQAIKRRHTSNADSSSTITPPVTPQKSV